LPSLASWGRVRDYRAYQLAQMSNVEIYFDSLLATQDVLEFGFEHVAIATGASWRRDGVGRAHVVPMSMDPLMPIYTPDDMMGARPANISGRVVIFDDDHYYMGGVMAQLLVSQGCKVQLVTPAAYVSDWTRNTLEQATIHRHLAQLGVDIILNQNVSAILAGGVVGECVYSGRTSEIEADAVMLVTARQQNDTLWQELRDQQQSWADYGIASVKVLGDAQAPGPIAWATYAGHRYARELDSQDIGDALPFRREVTALAVA